jgi:Zn-dependent alcohol dehydrogenase
MSNKAAFVEHEKGPVVVRDAKFEQPGEGEVLIRVRPRIIDPLCSSVQSH